MSVCVLSLVNICASRVVYIMMNIELAGRDYDMARARGDYGTVCHDMKIYLNSHKQRLGVTSLSARLLSLGTLPPSRARGPRPASGLSLTPFASATNILFASLRFINIIVSRFISIFL